MVKLLFIRRSILRPLSRYGRRWRSCHHWRSVYQNVVHTGIKVGILAKVLGDDEVRRAVGVILPIAVEIILYHWL